MHQDVLTGDFLCTAFSNAGQLSVSGWRWLDFTKLSGMDTVVSAFQFLLLSGALLLAGSLELSRGPCRCYCESVLGCGDSGFCFVD